MKVSYFLLFYLFLSIDIYAQTSEELPDDYCCSSITIIKEDLEVYKNILKENVRNTAYDHPDEVSSILEEHLDLLQASYFENMIDYLVKMHKKYNLNTSISL